MGLNTRLGAVCRNTQLDALNALVNGGKLSIYSGTQPTDPDTSIGDSTLLAEFTLPTPCFAAASAGVLTANAITSVGAVLSGTAAWFRIWNAGKTVGYIDGSVGTVGCNMNLNSVAISSGATVSVTSFTHTLPLQGA